MRLVVQPTPEEADKDIAASAQLGQTNSPARGAEHRQPEMLDGEAPMNIRRLLFAALIVTCWAGVALAQDLAVFAKPEQLGFSPDRLKRITDAYQGYVDRGELPGAVMVIARNGKIAYAEAIGFQDREKKTAMKKDAIFRLASMTKPIVSVGGDDAGRGRQARPARAGIEVFAGVKGRQGWGRGDRSDLRPAELAP
jgi:hypothetical protein